MMNKKGFTLVELMVVIVIIGVLAAVALPKFADAINKSRASEVPQKLKQTYNAMVVYEGENGNYSVSAAAGAIGTAPTASQAARLGVDYTSKFFNYGLTLTGTPATAFVIASAPKSKMGVLETTDEISMNEAAVITASANWKKYVGSFTKSN